VDSVEASVVNGGVDMQFAAPLDSTDTVELTTVNGGVTIELPSESKATIAARAVNGGVRVSDELQATQEEESHEFERRRRFNGTMNGGGARINVSVTNGGIRISRAANTTS
jgi:DUF4097 and DUF4098 domain-containing protein YvlB